METIVSQDGTTIAFDCYGSGPPVVLVGGAFQYRAFDKRTTKLAKLLSSDFCVYHYDRRGRGDSGNTLPYGMEREIEDLEALLAHAGGSVNVFGMSSGGALALETAKRSTNIRKLALYEVPFIVDVTHPPLPDDFLPRLNAALAADRPAAAVTQFLAWVGVPAAIVAAIRCTPAWPKFKAVAHTLPYDVAFFIDHHQGRPLKASEWTEVTRPTLTCAGGKSPDWIRNAMQQLAAALPDALHRTLPGQNHAVKRQILAPALTEFFTT
jgi:pimeloyl-ACP methyl ester carboxylesterase